MIAIAELSIQDFAPPPASVTRVAAAATHQLVLARQFNVVADGPAAEFRKAPPQRTVVALALDTAVSGDECALIDQLLEHGTIALIITSPTWAVIRLRGWPDAPFLPFKPNVSSAVVSPNQIF